MLSLCSFTFVLGAQKKRLVFTVLLNTQTYVLVVIMIFCTCISSGFMNTFLHLFKVLKRSVFLSIRVF